MVLMLLGTLNFLTSYLLLTGKFSAVIRNSEIRLQAFIIPLSVIILFLGVTSQLDLTFDRSLRVACFETITALSTSGFSFNVDRIEDPTGIMLDMSGSSIVLCDNATP